MEKIKRKVEEISKEKYEVDAFGINSKGTFTIACKDGTIFNINGIELNNLKTFLKAN
jgi:hypothetical protein